MKKRPLKGCLTWIGIIFLVIIIALSAFLITKPDVVNAVLSFQYMTSIFARVNLEIMLPTPYGRYYNDLYWKHFTELGRILKDYPVYRADMDSLMRLYIPHIEATLDGRGDEVYIKQSQVDQLQAFFDDLIVVSNDALRSDILSELARTPLQDFVGMSMDETLAHIESTWARDFSGQLSPTSTIFETKTVNLEP